MTTYRVTAPMILLKIRGVGDKAVINSFYAGAVVPDSAEQVDPDNVLRHLDRGWIEEIDDAPAPEPAPSKAPEPDPDAVPDGNADEVLVWVGGDREKAARALAAEKAGKQRKVLVEQLTKLVEAK